MLGYPKVKYFYIMSSFPDIWKIYSLYNVTCTFERNNYILFQTNLKFVLENCL